MDELKAEIGNLGRLLVEAREKQTKAEIALKAVGKRWVPIEVRDLVIGDIYKEGGFLVRVAVLVRHPNGTITLRNNRFAARPNDLHAPDHLVEVWR